MYTPYSKELRFFSPRIQSVGNQTRHHHSLLLPAVPTKLDINLLHRRMGHTSFYACKILAKQLNIELIGQQQICETCELTKSQRKISHEPQERAEQPGQLIHSNMV